MFSQLQASRRETLFEDNFEDETEEQKDWIFPSAGNWYISTVGSRVLQQSDRGARNSAAIVGEKDWFSYIAQAEIRIEHSGDAGVFAYWNSSLKNYRLRTIHVHARRKLQIAKRIPKGGEKHHTIPLNETPFHLEHGRWYVFQLEVTTHDTYTYLRGKVWPKGKTELGTWLLGASDHSPERYESGQAGVWTMKSGSSYRGTKFDNFTVFRNTGID